MPTRSDVAPGSAIKSGTKRTFSRFVPLISNEAGKKPSQRGIYIFVLAGLLIFFPLAGINGGSFAAQDASPVSDPDLATQLGLNEGVSLQQLAGGTVEVVPPAPAVLRLEEVSVAPRQRAEMTLTRGPELLYVVSGEFIAEDSIGFRAVLATGRQVLFNGGFGYSLINESDQPASFLRLAVWSLQSGTNAATPSPSPSTPSSGNALILSQSHLNEVPTSPAELFLGRMSWEPQADSGLYWHDGTFGMILESGELTVHSPSGLAVPLVRGSAQMLSAGVPHHDDNLGRDAATVLVFAFVSTDGGLLRVGSPAGTATPTT
jgi:hypothetical protein